MEPDLQALVRQVVARVVRERATAAPHRPDPVASPPANAATAPCACTAPPATALERATETGAPEVAVSGLLDAGALAGLARGTVVLLAAGTVVTPLARETARERGLALREGAGDPPRATVAVGADHGGFRLKESLAEWLRAQGHRVIDVGTHADEPCDYPDFALAVAQAVASGAARFGVMVDGAGIGSAMVGNRVAGVLAAPCASPAAARNAREHNDANMLTLAGRQLEQGEAVEILRTFLATPLGEERHRRRVDKIRRLDLRAEARP